MSIWLVMVAAGLITDAIRLSFIYLVGRFPPPELVQRSLRFVPPAVLSAILVPELFMQGGRLAASLSNARLLAGLAAIAVGAWRKNTLLTIVTGMVVLLVLEYLM